MVRSPVEIGLDHAFLDWHEPAIVYARMVEEYSVSRVDYWRQYPYLKLLTDDRVRPLTEEDKAVGYRLPPYIFGYYPVEITAVQNHQGAYSVWVDCETGKLVAPASYTVQNPHGVPFESKPAYFYDILRIQSPYSYLNAEGLVIGLKHHLEHLQQLREHPESDPELVNAYWLLLDPARELMIQDVMRETGLRTIFTRSPGPLPPKLDGILTGLTQI